MGFWSFIETSTKINQKPTFLRDGQVFIKDSVEKTNILNRFFHSVFNPPNLHPPTKFTTPDRGNSECLSNIHLEVAEVSKVLRNLDPNKACGPDGIPSVSLIDACLKPAFNFIRLGEKLTVLHFDNCFNCSS